MSKILDTLILFLFCSGIFFFVNPSIYSCIPIGGALLLSLLLDCIEDKKIQIVLLVLYLVLSVSFPSMACFAPLFLYKVVLQQKWYFSFVFILPFTICYLHQSLFFFLVYLCLGTLSIYMKYKTVTLEQLTQNYIHLRDSSKELELVLTAKNHNIVKKQDLNLKIATLKERNRIARDIHDSVGHVLSSALLQIGALIVTTPNPEQKEGLTTLKTTLDNGMNSIRDSIHHLYQTSIDLKVALQTLVDDFHFCDIDFYFHLDSSIEDDLNDTILAIVKEAFTNIVKHSNATHVTLSFQEHPILYQLIISDNGTKQSKTSRHGIGLKNIQERIQSVQGQVLVTQENGFRIFITIPKVKEEDE